MINLIIILLIFLGIIALIDLTFKKVPAIFLTGLILMTAILQINNINYGIIAFVFALLLYEGRFFNGIADIKFIVILGLLLNSNKSLIIFILLTLVIGFVYKIIYRFVLKREANEEIPFLPALYVVFCLSIIMGVIG